MDAAAVAFVRDFVRCGKPVGVICHGPWSLVEADLPAFCDAVVRELAAVHAA